MSAPKKRPAGGPRGKAAPPAGRTGGRAATGRATGGRGAPAPAKRGGAPAPAKRGAAASSAPRSATKGSRGAPGRRPGPPAGRAPERGLDGTQVEGRHAVRELLLAGNRRVREVLIAEEMDPAEILQDIADLARDLKVPLREISRRRLDAESRTEASQGVVAHAEPLRDHSLADLAAGNGSAPPFLLALDGVTDPGNLGAIIRTAECAGVTGLVLPRHRAVHVTPTVTKAAAGAVEHVPMSLVGGLPTAIEDLRKRGVWVVGLDAGGDRSLHRSDLGSGPVCLVLGAEGEGLSRLVRQRCDEVVSIPLLGSLSSLNVATAAAVAVYEVVRRRSEGS